MDGEPCCFLPTICLGLHVDFGATLHHEGIFVQEDPALQEATASEPLTIEVRLACRCPHLQPSDCNKCCMRLCAWGLSCVCALHCLSHFGHSFCLFLHTLQEEYEMQRSWSCDSNSALCQPVGLQRMRAQVACYIPDIRRLYDV